MINKARKVLLHAVLILISIYSVFPVYWMVICSLKSGREIFEDTLIPLSPTLENFQVAFQSVPFGRMIWNSIQICLITALVQIVVAILFAYACIRWDFKGKRFLTASLIIGSLVPLVAIMVPNYVEIINMGLNDTILGIVLPNLCSAFANLSLLNSFNSMPRTLIDAARLDGSTDFQILKDIVLPVMKNPIASTTIIQIVNTWNAYMWPLVVSSTERSMPVQVGLRSFLVSDGEMWGPAMAAATAATIPVLIMYIFFSRNIVSFGASSGIK